MQLGWLIIDVGELVVLWLGWLIIDVEERL